MALLVLIAACRQVQAFIGPMDLRHMVSGAQLVVRARVIRTEEARADNEADTATLRVEKVVFGQCAKTIKLGYDVDEVHHEPYIDGAVYYLCLKPHEDCPGLYDGVNAGANRIRVTKGKVDLSRIPIPEFVRPHLKQPTPQALETVMRWLRGLTLDVKPTEDTFRCDEPIELSATLTNTSTLPMKLLRASAHALGPYGWIRLWDPHGFRVLAQPVLEGNHRPDEVDQPTPRISQEVFTLAPGGSFVCRARFRCRLDDFVQDPAGTRTLTMRYDTGFWCTPPRHVWQGQATARRPIRLLCPYRRWAADLQQPNAQWSVSIGNAGSGSCTDWRPLTAAPGHSVEVAIGLEYPKGASGAWTQFSRLDPIGQGLAGSIASCFRVERQGKAVAGPKADTKAVAKWLTTLPRDGYDHELKLDLAGCFPFDRPGSYRVRLVPPGANGPSSSNVLTVTVPE